MANVHPLIANTIAQWDLQDDLVDRGPNGLDLTVETAGTGAFADLSDIRGYKFRDIPAHAQSVLAAPSSALLRSTNEFTIEYLCMPLATTGTQVMFEVATGVGSKFWAIYVASGQHGYGDTHTPGGGSFSPFTGQGTVGAIHHIAHRVQETGVAGNQRVAIFVDGVKYSESITRTTLTYDGTEIFRVGGEYPAGIKQTDCIIGSVRVLSVARSDADIAADAAYTLGIAAGGVTTTADYIVNRPEHRPFYYLKVTGLPYYFFSIIDPTDTKWGAAAWTLATGYVAEKGMRVPSSTFDQSLKDLIGGISSAERVTLDMTDFDVTDTNGKYKFFQRLLAPGRFTANTAAVWGDLKADIDPDDVSSTTVISRASSFVGSTDTYFGGETIGVGSVSAGPGDQTIGIGTRNKYPCHSGYPPTPYYRVDNDPSALYNPNAAGFVTQGGPITMVGRSAALYIGHLKPDGTPEPEDNSLCRLIGHVKGVTSGKDPGIYSFEIESVMADLNTAKVAPALAHATLAGGIYLPNAEDRTFEWGAHVQENGGRIYSGSATITIDDGGTNTYLTAEDLRRAINTELAASGFTITGTAASWDFTAHLAIVAADGVSSFVLGVSTASAVSTAGATGVARISGWISRQVPAATTGGSLTAHPPSRSLITALGYNKDKTASVQDLASTVGIGVGLQADRPVPAVFLPANAIVPSVALRAGPDANGQRFFTDQGDGSGRAYVRFSTGHIGIVLSSTTSSLSLTGIILWESDTIRGQILLGNLYLTATDALTVDQVIHIAPTGVPGLANGDGLFPCIMASKGYDLDGEYNIFPVGVGLGLDGILDKDAFRNLSTLIDPGSIAIDIDAQTKFMDLWMGYAKERGLYLVWDPEVEEITVRQLQLPNYAAANTFTLSESNRAHEKDRSECVVDYGNLRMSWTFKYGWDPIEKKFVAPEITVNDPFAMQAYQQASRNEVIEDRLIPASNLSNMPEIVSQFASRLRFTQQPWAKVTRSVNKTGLLLSPGRYHKIVDATIVNPFTGTMGIDDDDELYGFMFAVRSNLSDGSVTVTFLVDQTTDQTTLRPWAPTGLLSFVSGGNGYNDVTGQCTMAKRFSSSTDPAVYDGLDFLVGDKVTLITYESNGAPGYTKNGTVVGISADGATVVIDAGLGAVSSSVETIMILQDWASATTVRRTGALRVAFQGSGDDLLIDGTDRLHKWS